MTRGEWLNAWRTQCAEWQRIGDEMALAGDVVTCFQISLEQRKRALAEGRRLVTYSDLERATP